MLWVILVQVVGAMVAPWLCRRWPRHAGLLLALAPLTGLAILCTHLPMAPGETAVRSYPWAPSLDVALALRLDGLSLTFGLLITGIGALVVLYSQGYMLGEPRLGRFYSYLLAFTGAMLGLVFSDDLMSLFVFWELTSVFSYLLIGFNHDEAANRKKALKALLVTGAGGLALLAGLILLALMGREAGLTGDEPWRLSTLLAVDVRESGLYPAALLLIAVGCFTKSAQTPFHFWLPAAMAGPTPVSSFLHSATMVKAGVYLLARLSPTLGGTTLWIVLLTAVGATTMVVGGAMAVAQRDMKYVLAYTTVAVLGTLVMLLGPGTDLAVKAMVVFLVAHALYKAALFQVAGNVDHATGTRDLHVLGGLRGLMPLTAIAAVLAALSKSGFPGTLGFVGKELIYKAKLDLESLGVLLVGVALVANILLTATALMVAWWPFFGRRRETPHEAHEAPWTMTLGPLLMGGAGLLVGLLPWSFDRGMGSAMASAILGKPKQMELALIPPITTQVLIAFGLSVATLAGGFALFLALRRLTPLLDRSRDAARVVGPAAVYDLLYDGLLAGSRHLTDFVHSGKLRTYLLIIMLLLVALTAGPVWRTLPLTQAVAMDLRALHVHEALLLVVMAASAISATMFRSRLAAVAALGITGFGMALLFTLFSAPDLALTQIMVETLSVLLFVYVFYFLPPHREQRRVAGRLRDAAVATAGGVVMATLVLASAAVDHPALVSEAMTRWSVPEAKGANVVNVILVDFRALDTLGEVLVVAAAAVGVYALLRLRPTRGRESGAQP